MKKKKVFVGLSGGVDSAVAAARLIDEGHQVVGVFIKVWHPEWLVCNWEAERLDAMRVASHLNIPFLTCDAEAAYRDGVAKYFISEYEAGRTPNPDVLCNREVKFGAFMEFAKSHGADSIATGHYARRSDDELGVPHLLRGVDAGKDQTYFLWTMTGEQLEYVLFPIGDTRKEDIRKEAQRRGLPVFEKRDSQGVCFLGHIDIKEFLGHYIKLTPGPVINQAGDVVGRHDGAVVYTLGQRHGFTLNTKTTDSAPHYVLQKNVAENTLTVGPTPPVFTTGASLMLHSVTLRNPFIAGDTIAYQTRYRQNPNSAIVTSVSEGSVVITPNGTYEAAASGQSCVLYQGEECLGGGIIG
ncbi:tRNA 2-thiouridine(34) synthase MnmA [Patescibacteria group bacterium]|nr:tRNA 2-thiouridine(34) synthase MnmA [Patescibacteria group bacterium]